MAADIVLTDPPSPEMRARWEQEDRDRVVMDKVLAELRGTTNPRLLRIMRHFDAGVLTCAETEQKIREILASPREA